MLHRVHKIQTLRIQCHFSGIFLLNTCNIFEKSKVALLSEITEEKYTKKIGKVSIIGRCVTVYHSLSPHVLVTLLLDTH